MSAMLQSFGVTLIVAVVLLAGYHVTGENERKDSSSKHDVTPMKRVQKDVSRLEPLLRSKRSQDVEEQHNSDQDRISHSRHKRCDHCSHGRSRSGMGHHGMRGGRRGGRHHGRDRGHRHGMRQGMRPGPNGMRRGRRPGSFNMRYEMESHGMRQGMRPGPNGQGIGPYGMQQSGWHRMGHGPHNGMGHGPRGMGHGPHNGMGHGPRGMGHGQRGMGHGSRGMGHGPRGMGNGRRGHGCPHCGHHQSHHSEHNGQPEMPVDGIDPDTHLPILPSNVQRKLNFLSTAQNHLTVQLHREIATHRSNVVYSPYGIFQTLSMIFMGSERRTAFQMVRILHLVGMVRHIHLPIMHQNILLDNPVNSTLEVANGIFIHANVTVRDVFGELLESSFGANVSSLPVEHADNPEGSVNDIIDSQTNSQIQEVFMPDTISLEPSSLLLLNVMYFKGKWKTPFQLEQTQQMFHQTPTQQVPVDMMTVEGMFKMGVFPGHAAKLLELPYANDRFSMMVVLPHGIDGLMEIEETLLAEDLAVNLDTIMPSMMKVTLPKFKLDSTLTLKESLQLIGMTRAFSTRASYLGGISPDNLHVQEIIHKAVVEVVEDGDITTNSIPETAQDGEMSEFRCDRPFLFIIRDNVSKVNLFIGKFSGEAEHEA